MKKVVQDAYNYEDTENCQLPDHRPAEDHEPLPGGYSIVHALNTDINKTLLRDETPLREEIHKLQKRLQELEDFEVNTRNRGGVFISYSHQDSDFVNALTSRFKKDKISYWRDDKDLMVGQVIDKAISEGIQRHHLFLIVLTENSIDSRWVERELDEASYEEIEGRKIILPIVAGNLHIREVPARLQRRRCAILNQCFEKEYLLLKRSIREHLRSARRVSS